MRTHKPRAMLVRKDQLRDHAFEGLRPGRSHHAKRLATHAEALDPYLRDPDHFIETQIASPLGAPVGIIGA